ncbi:MAG: hypothetical protein IJJ73_00905 [Bacteroidaceae bacterium]|nr:hypothetical protein [Bacteroidaceae bacterium]
MKRFIIKTLVLVAVFVGINLLLFLAVPKDKTDYLYEYNHKTNLLDTVPQPRIIFMGGSSIAFNNDSRTIRDSLGCNIINCGLHAGIGIRIPFEDGLQYIRKGDIVVLQIEYANYFSGGNGEPETLPAFMSVTGWRIWKNFNANQWKKLIQGIPRENITNLIHLARRTLKGSQEKPSQNQSFVYTKEGFNEFGDEVSHLDYPNLKYLGSGKKIGRAANKDFIEWLGQTIGRYEMAGAQVIMLPPACIMSSFNKNYNDHIKDALAKIKHPYIVEPSSMALPDSCMFNTEYHLNREGVRQNTQNIIRALKNNSAIQALKAAEETNSPV